VVLALSAAGLGSSWERRALGVTRSRCPRNSVWGETQNERRAQLAACGSCLSRTADSIG
jgi:hypothetical protein